MALEAITLLSSFRLSMDSETSYGIIPFRHHLGLWQVLLVQHRQGHWSFPKGRIEADENPEHCAVRELLEETGLKVVRYLTDRTFVEHYQLIRDDKPKHKSVTYYVAEVEGEATPQLSELLACQWFDVDKVVNQITFPAARDLFADVLKTKLL